MLVVLGLLITMFFAFLALFAGRIAPYGEDQYRKEVGVEADGTPIFETLPKRAEPSRDYPFGTTVGSLDVFSRVIHGARLAFGVVILSTLLSMVDRRAAGLDVRATSAAASTAPSCS